MKKLLYINNFEPPYRVPFFNLLGEKYEMTLALSDKPETKTERNAKWFVDQHRNYTQTYLKTRTFRGTRIGFDVLKMIPKYDFVFMDMYSNPTNALAIIWMNLHRIPFIMSVDGMLKREKEAKIKKLIKSYFLKSPKIVLSPSGYTDECLQMYGVRKEQIRRYHFSSIENTDIREAVPSEVEKQALRNELGVCEEKMLLSVGRFTYEAGYGKGYDTILQAAEKMGSRDIGIYIVGDEPTEEFVKWKEDKGLTNIHYVGFKSKEELARYYDAADAFVIASRGDVWGLVVNEAMAHGLPVISSDLCLAGLELVKDGKNGCIFETGNADALYGSIRKVFYGDKSLEEQGNCSLEIIRDYSIETMAKTHIEEFESFLKERR